jgi:tripartite-type tricarboxylate transporter receptor subunit TctC
LRADSGAYCGAAVRSIRCAAAHDIEEEGAMGRSMKGGAIVALLSMVSSLALGASADESYPSRPVQLIVPFAAGGSTSVIARLVGQKLSEGWHQPVIVVNRPGAATAVGTEAVFRSAPDGYTLLVVSSSHAINAILRKTPYDAVRDFAPVSMLTHSPYVLVVHPSLPVKNLKEFVALARSRPDELDYASTGAANHLATELFAIAAKVKMHHIPYKGGGPAIADLLGGHVQVHITTAVNMIPLVNNGRLKGLAITGDKRLPALPNLPTFGEAGLPAFKSGNWNGMLVPAKTPPSIVAKLSGDIGKVLQMPDIREKLDAQGNFAAASSPEEFSALIKSEIERFAEVVRVAHITPQ